MPGTALQETPTRELEQVEGDLPAAGLPHMRPARDPYQAGDEARLYRRIVPIWRRLAAYLWRVLDLPGTYRKADPPLPWSSFGPKERAEFARALTWLQQSLCGYAQTPETYAQPRNAERAVSTPIYDGKPLLPGEMRVAFRNGLKRASLLLGKGKAEDLLGGRNEEAIQDLLKTGFERLSDGARLRIGGILRQPGERTQSVEGILDEAMTRGENPLVVARRLRTKFAEIEGYNWERLARTEVSCAQNHAMLAGYEASGYRRPRDAGGAYIELPPYHPNCCLPDTPVVPDGVVSALRATYSGPVVVIQHRLGSLTVTPNHPILTPEGFRPARDIRTGDRVVMYDGPESETTTPIADVYSAAFDRRGGDGTTLLRAEDLHGDASNCSPRVANIMHTRSGSRDSAFTLMLRYVAGCPVCCLTRPELASMRRRYIDQDLVPLLSEAPWLRVKAVQSVREETYTGDVYDLQTRSTLYVAGGYVISNCVCGSTIDPDTGWVLPDVAATACEICQEALQEAYRIVGDERANPPEGQPQPEPPAAPQPKPAPKPVEPKPKPKPKPKAKPPKQPKPSEPKAKPKPPAPLPKPPESDEPVPVGTIDW